MAKGTYKIAKDQLGRVIADEPQSGNLGGILDIGDYDPVGEVDKLFNGDRVQFTFDDAFTAGVVQRDNGAFTAAESQANRLTNNVFGFGAFKKTTQRLKLLGDAL